MNEQSTGTALLGAWTDANGAERGRAQRAPFWPAFALLVATYALGAVAGLQWATVSGAASPIWPAAGIAVACILHAGKRVWPGIVIGLLIAAQLTGAAHPLWSQFLMGFGNAAAAVVAAGLIRRYAGPNFSDFTTVRSVVLLLIAALAGAALSALNGAAALTLAGTISLPQAPAVFETWLFGDAAGILIIGAMIVSWRAARRSDWRPLNISHLLLVCGAVTLLSWFVFFGSEESRAWAIYPALVWAALALRVQGASVALMVATILACAGTAMGLGPFAMTAGGQPDFLLLQQFLGVTSATTLLLAAAVDERNAEAKLRGMADRELHARELALGAQDRLRLALEASATGMWEWDVETNGTSWSPEVYPIMGVATGGFDGTADAFNALLHPDDRERVWSTVTAALERRQFYSCEFRIVRPDGEVRWVANRGRGLYDVGGRPLRMIGTVADITGAVEQREALERTSTLLQLIGASAPIALYAKDVDGRYIYANAVVAAATGTADGELVGKTDYDWAPPDVARALLDNDAKAMALGTVQSAEEVIVHSDGGRRIYRALKSPLRDRDGKIIGLVGVSTDVTEQKKAEEQLAVLAERAEIAQQAARSSLYEYDPATNTAVRDPLIRENLGYSPEELPEQHAAWEGLIHADDLSEFRNTVSQALDRAERFAMEYRVRRKDGSIMWIADVGRIIRDADGRPKRIVGMATDVTERKEAEEELRRTTSLLRLIGDSAGGMIFAKDRQGRYMYANEQVSRITGKPFEEIRGKDDTSWANAELARLYMDNDRRIMDAGMPEEVDEEALAPDGSRRLYRSHKAPLRDATGEVIGLVGLATDITDRKAAEDREQLLAREVDHRAKNLLAVVQSVVQMTRADGIDAFKAGVTGRIQSLARAHSLLAEARWEGVGLEQIVAEELAAFRVDGHDRAQIVGEPVRLTPAAAQSLALVLHELATNAAKYGALSREEGSVRISWRRDRDGPVTLEWRESSGAAAKPPTRSGFGSRLIQASVQRQLQGSLAYHWGDDGLMVQLTIPQEHLIGAPSELAPPASGARPEARPASRPASCRILIVEDEALIGLQLEQALEENGCEVVGVASSVTEALRLIDEEQPEGAVLDINLAGEKSYPIAERLAADGVPFVFCTGYAGETVLPQRFANVALIRKPFDAKSVAGLFVGQASTGEP